MTLIIPKTTVRLAGFALAGNEPITWAFTVGTRPYVTKMTVTNGQWGAMKSLMDGKTPVSLIITDRSRRIEIKELTILSEAANSSPHRTSFMVADKRWRWEYLLIARDYNMVKRSGDRMNLSNVPIPGAVTADKYQYRGYSLDQGTKTWTPKEALKDLLEQLEGDDGKGFHIGELPLKGGKGQVPLQNTKFNDSGDVAMQRLLSALPGTEVWVDENGIVQVFDAADLKAAEEHFNSLPQSTWDGQKAEFIHRHAIRPEKIIVYYTREVEAVFEFDDNYGGTVGSKKKNDPVIENVIQTVDPVTTLENYFDFESGKIIPKAKVAAGTWVPVRQWLAAMEKERKAANIVSWPWTFKTIRRHWMIGDLAGALGAGGRFDTDDDGNVAARVSVLARDFRQAFRISRRYVERVQDIQAVRVGLLDPVTGAKAMAAAWGQMTIIPSTKGELSAYRKNPKRKGIYRMLDTLPASGKNLLTKVPLPLSVNMIDRDAGIFRLNFMASPYGLDARHVPCHLQHPSGKITVHTRDLRDQDSKAVGDGFEVGTNAQLLANTAEFKVMLTIIPGAPNNKKRYHAIEVKAEDIDDLYRAELRIQGGKGPTLEHYVSQDENTARFQWSKDAQAKATLERLLGLNSDDPNKAGLVDDPKTPADESKMLGYILINGAENQGQLVEHAKLVAAELMIPFADNLEGDVTTRLPGAGWTPLKGNMGGVSIHVSNAPSAKVVVSHQFPGQQRLIPRLALAADATRLKVWGILGPQGDK